MYYPYMRGKKHELAALLEIPTALYQRVLPIVEPVKSSPALYRSLAVSRRPFIFITNPSYGDFKEKYGVLRDTLIDGTFRDAASVTLGFVINQHFQPRALQAFLTDYPGRAKAIIFRHEPAPATVAAAATMVRANPEVHHIIFDESRVRTTVMDAFDWHPRRVRIYDGFQKQERNVDYAPSSHFRSRYETFGADGFAGFGDYLTIGDSYTDGGGLGRVVALHMTIPSGGGLEVHHFLSVSDREITGRQPPKFREACASLAASPQVLALPATSGLNLFLNWSAEDHYPGLGMAKQASMQHHLEMVGRLV